MGNFGEQLKREREMRGVSLDEISTATRIAPRFLEAIENEQWGQLPGGVFNRGFVRSVAHYLGLDEEKILADYGLATGDRQKVPVWTGSPPAVATDRAWLLWVLGFVIVIALVAGGWFSARRIYAWRTARRVKMSASGGAQAVQPNADMPADGSAAATGVASFPTAEGSSNKSSAPLAAASTVAAVPTVAAAAAAAAVPSAGTGTMPGATKSPFDLTIGTVKNTRVTVAADSHRVFGGTMRTGQEYKFSARDTFQISARDAGALQLFLNGKSLPPIGRLGHSAKVTLTHDNLHDALKDPAGGAH